MRREDALKYYWKDEHAELVARVPGVVRYVQNHCVGGTAGEEPPYAGLGEVWFESREAAEQAAYSAEWQVVLEDAATSWTCDASRRRGQGARMPLVRSCDC
jgi:uncharacterized protein (TIGR02118 family)